MGTAFKRQVADTLKKEGYPTKADSEKMNKVMNAVILTYLVTLVTMVYGPIAAMLAELFPTRWLQGSARHRKCSPIYPRRRLARSCGPNCVGGILRMLPSYHRQPGQIDRIDRRTAQGEDALALELVQGLIDPLPTYTQ